MHGLQYAFDAFHPESTSEVLADYYVGDLAPEDIIQSSEEFPKRIRKLKEEFFAMGLYESNKLFFATQFGILLTLAAASLSIMALFPTNIPMLLVSAALMGLFWQQCGWLSHDFLHHAVFRNRDMNNLVGYLLGGVFQGFSVSWWKDKHNTHHAQPNRRGLLRRVLPPRSSPRTAT
ncbi:hypothetical protein AMAG_09711 [Allomyces macrogynus ATCC 38327]|uniref:Fatty acid desaturase domain-containing protein n=1 Tax=Allomyces macrogynus (strain ATCC 38327) TaxID=578462 RepID=A0A0L0STJ8_ALLM3|nr:hypothetical protein AMAG_09711 [Allomyces macrogynus ATCC 38327]|eukprot:KNE65730.1 hypothetical protein AMAG_09711 [Allomyces macrogynus ATCC 38327]